MEAPFIWQEIEMHNGRDLMEAIMRIWTQDDADDFMSAYAEVCDDDEHALHNIGYIARLVHDFALTADQDDGSGEVELFTEYEARRILKLFDVEFQTMPRTWFADGRKTEIEDEDESHPWEDEDDE